jgi:hypothetical protein
MKERINKEMGDDPSRFLADLAAFDEGEQNQEILSVSAKKLGNDGFGCLPFQHGNVGAEVRGRSKTNFNKTWNFGRSSIQLARSCSTALVAFFWQVRFMNLII